MKLTVINHNGIEVVDSREVAQSVEIRHADLLEKLNTYSDFLANGKFRSLDFFVPSVYVDAQGKTRPCYLLTKKGCDMVANKMTGEKGVLFTAAYVTAFEKMREALTEKKPMTAAQMFAMQAQVNLEQEQRLAALESGQKQIHSAMQTAFSELAAPATASDNWQDATRNKIRQLCIEHQLNFQTFTGQLYKELEESANCNLNTRLNNLRNRMKQGGAKYAECQAVSKLTIVSQDVKLREIFTAILQRRAAALAAAKIA